MTARHDGRKRADYVRDEERAWFPVLERLGRWGLTELLIDRGMAPGSAYRAAKFIEAHQALVDDGLTQQRRPQIRAQLRSIGPPHDRDRLGSASIAIPGYVKWRKSSCDQASA
jgi:hypothetical protein